LEMRLYQTVSSLTGEDGDFTIATVDQFSRQRIYGARKVILATGYYDLPNYLEVAGEDLPKVMHYYHDPHPYYDQKVLVIGGKNSAAIAALDLWRHGAHVTLVHRGEAMHRHVKYWILPDINNRIKNGEVTAYFSSSVTSISEDSVELLTPRGAVTLANDYVFALTGYHPDFDFLTAAGVRMEGKDRSPECDPQSLESNIPGLYLAGVIVAGMRTNEIFIENGRFHGRQIAQDIEAKLAGRTSVKVG
jgi:thioredoxin reductase (NADPH)